VHERGGRERLEDAWAKALWDTRKLYWREDTVRKSEQVSKREMKGTRSFVAEGGHIGGIASKRCAA